LTSGFLTGTLILVPRTWIKKITAINTQDLFHNNILLVRENGKKITNYTNKRGMKRTKRKTLQRRAMGIR
jgi:hypothetical protein